MPRIRGDATTSLASLSSQLLDGNGLTLRLSRTMEMHSDVRTNAESFLCELIIIIIRGDDRLYNAEFSQLIVDRSNNNAKRLIVEFCGLRK